MVTNGLIEKSVAETLVQQLVARTPAPAPTLPAKRPLQKNEAPPPGTTSETGAEDENFDQLMEKAKRNKMDALLYTLVYGLFRSWKFIIHDGILVDLYHMNYDHVHNWKPPENHRSALFP